MQGLGPRNPVRDRPISHEGAPPWAFHGNANPNSWPPRHRTCDETPVLDTQFAVGQVEGVFGECDAKRPREIPGTTTESMDIDGRPARPAARHQAHVIDRFQRSNEHGCRVAFLFGDGVDEMVNPVVEVDIRDAGRAVERRIAAGWTTRGVTRRIVLADVGFGLDDHPRGHAKWRAMHEHFADELFGHGQRGARVELARENDSHAPQFTRAKLLRLAASTCFRA